MMPLYCLLLLLLMLLYKIITVIQYTVFGIINYISDLPAAAVRPSASDVVASEDVPELIAPAIIVEGSTLARGKVTTMFVTTEELRVLLC